MQKVSLRLPQEVLRNIDERVEESPIYESRSQFIRAQVRQGLRGDYEKST